MLCDSSIHPLPAWMQESIARHVDPPRGSSCSGTGSHSYGTTAAYGAPTALHVQTPNRCYSAVRYLGLHYNTGSTTSTAAIERGRHQSQDSRQQEKRNRALSVHRPPSPCKSPFRRLDRLTGHCGWHSQPSPLFTFSSSSSQQRARHGLCFCSIDSPAHRRLDVSHDTCKSSTNAVNRLPAAPALSLH